MDREHWARRGATVLAGFAMFLLLLSLLLPWWQVGSQLYLDAGTPPPGAAPVEGGYILQMSFGAGGSASALLVTALLALAITIAEVWHTQGHWVVMAAGSACVGTISAAFLSQPGAAPFSVFTTESQAGLRLVLVAAIVTLVLTGVAAMFLSPTAEAAPPVRQEELD